MHVEHTFTNQFELLLFFEKLKSTPMVLIIDEFEGIPETVLSEVTPAFRQIYHQRQNYALHALILVGVSTIAELVQSNASPFNIADAIPIDYFSLNEVDSLIQR